jgi:molecular chaperone DnaK
MVKDAEAHADEDKRLHELVTARNQLDALVHSVRKSLGAYSDKVGSDEKAKIESALKDAEAAIKGDDKAEIDAKSEALASAAQKLGERMYADAQAAAGGAAGAAGGAAGAGGGAGQQGGGRPGDDAKVVDAEYTEVKDKKG